MSWDLVEMWHSMSIIPKAVVFTLVLMSVYCFATGIERAIVFSKAKKQSRDLLKLISGLWREGKVEESIKLSSDKRFKNSHLAKVLVAGLNELQFQQDSQLRAAEVVESAKRAIERATIKGVQEFKRGLNGLATIGSTGPFVGLFGTVFGIITAFQGMRRLRVGRHRRRCRRYRGSPDHHRFRHHRRRRRRLVLQHPAEPRGYFHR